MTNKKRINQKNKKDNPICEWCSIEIKDKISSYAGYVFCSRECVDDYKFVAEKNVV